MMVKNKIKILVIININGIKYQILIKIRFRLEDYLRLESVDKEGIFIIVVYY